MIREALANAGVEPSDVDYVETHGTGTSLGDPIEVAPWGPSMGEGRSRTEALHIGSVKTNIGHLEAAAGIAGLIKVVLALNTRRSLHPCISKTAQSAHPLGASFRFGRHPSR